MNNFVTHLAGEKTTLDVTSSKLGEKRTPASFEVGSQAPDLVFLRYEKK